MKFVIILLLVSVAAIMAYIRLSPSDPALWHTDPRTAASSKGGFATRKTFSDPPVDLLTRLNAIALATPRTILLAGDPASGRMTWVTRSRFWGFPDYTTAAATPLESGSELSIFARLRYGDSDFGVNAARVARWLAQL